MGEIFAVKIYWNQCSLNQEKLLWLRIITTPYCHLTGSELSEVLSFDVAGETITVEHGHTHGAHKPSQMKIRLKSKCLVIQKNRKEASKKDREDQLFAGLILFRNWL